MSAAYFYFISLLFARTAIVFAACVIGLRLLGKRQIGQFNIYDLAMIMALANAVQNAMTSGTGNFTTGVVCAGVLLLLGRSISALMIRWPRIEHNLCGTPTILVNEGKAIDMQLKRTGVTEDQLDQSLRAHGITDIGNVKMAVLEVDGSLSVVPYPAASSR